MTFIICEIGSNWSSLEDCLNSIALAKNCGADAVKFQMFSQEELYGPGFYAGKSYDIRNWLPDLALKAEACDIEFMCTAFSPEGLDYVNPFVKRHKIASAELSHQPLLSRAHKTNKPVLLSTGASSLIDIGLALNSFDKDQLTLMYCIAQYPAKNVNLWGIDRLRRFGTKVGYSCHTADYTTPLLASVHHQADAIEKHFKIRDMETPDAPHSLGPKEFKLMCEMIRYPAKRTPNFPDTQEHEMVLKNKRRLMATCDISKGSKLKYELNYGIYRPRKEDTHGFSGFLWEFAHGKLALRDIKEGDTLGPNDFKKTDED